METCDNEFKVASVRNKIVRDDPMVAFLSLVNNDAIVCDKEDRRVLHGKGVLSFRCVS